MEDSTDEGFCCPALLMQYRFFKLSHYIHRYHCNFGPEDYSNIYVSDMQSNLNAAQRRRKQNQERSSFAKKKRGKKVVPEYDAFRQHKRA
jgi:hypothetical protein